MVDTHCVFPKVELTQPIPNIAYDLPTPVASPIQKSQIDDEIETAPVDLPAIRASKRRAATSRPKTYSYSEETPIKRARGRPPKTEPDQIPQNELKRMSPSERRYFEMRLKNNEASRRSRQSRKGKEDALFDELADLEDENLRLKEKDIELDAEIKRWRKRLMKLAKI